MDENVIIQAKFKGMTKYVVWLILSILILIAMGILTALFCGQVIDFINDKVDEKYFLYVLISIYIAWGIIALLFLNFFILSIINIINSKRKKLIVTDQRVYGYLKSKVSSGALRGKRIREFSIPLSKIDSVQKSEAFSCPYIKVSSATMDIEYGPCKNLNDVYNAILEQLFKYQNHNLMSCDAKLEKMMCEVKEAIINNLKNITPLNVLPVKNEVNEENTKLESTLTIKDDKPLEKEIAQKEKKIVPAFSYKKEKEALLVKEEKKKEEPKINKENISRNGKRRII